MLKEYSCSNKSCDFKKDFKGNEPMPKRCPDCKSVGCRVIYRTRTDTKTKGYCGVDALMKDNHRWSWSMGVNVEDIPKMNKLYPDRVYNPKTGQLLVKNRTEKKKLMKEHSLEEY